MHSREGQFDSSVIRP
nr:unnamed protein product [Callosobruchus chinensis]CAH7765647.1 unnamed protein product [Callosobruchus chinensis]